jgi:glycosyltransferase involved in cell wall biosynthesis
MSKKNKSLFVGCVPNSVDFNHPGDRRRYLYYLKNKNIQYEIADYEKSYDIVYLSISADISIWSNYRIKEYQKGNFVRIIFDLSDSYLSDYFLKDIFRGLYYYLTKKNSDFSFSYKSTLLKMIKSTDILLCTSIEQKKILQTFHSNVIVAKDFFGEETEQKKKDYFISNSNELNILWEGFSHGNLEIFKMIRKITDTIVSYKINLHFITDSDYCRIGTSYMCTSTFTILKKIFKGSNVEVNLYSWNKLTFSSIAIKCDFAIIPIPNDPVMIKKPENKLILLWSLGIPVIASRTPSYTRVMNSINENYLCDNIEDWRGKITEIVSSNSIRENYMTKAKNYIDENFSADSVNEIWDQVFKLEHC